MTPEQLALAIRNALAEAVAAGDLAVNVPDEVRVERPRNRDHGDWSTNISLQLAGVAGVPPRQIATFFSEVLVLGVPDANGNVVLVEPGLDVPLGGRLF